MTGPSADTTHKPAADPLHRPCDAQITWTRTNCKEALPGVLTALGWTFFDESMELGLTQMLVDLGAFARSRVTAAPPLDCTMFNVFFGRVAENVKVLRDAAAAVPGGSPAAVDQMLFGTSTDVGDYRNLRRYPIAAAKMPVAMALLSRRMRQVAKEANDRWSSTVYGEVLDLDAARSVLQEAQQLSAKVVRHHALASMLAQAVFNQMRTLSVAAGLPGRESSLATGLGGLEESLLASELWAVSRGEQSLEDFLGRRGYLGPGGSELSAHSWRETPAPLQRLITTYQDMPDDESPTARQLRQNDKRATAEHELLSRLGVSDRAKARLIFSGRRFIVMREVGKNAWLKTLDLARYAGRSIGAALVELGALNHADDVFCLTSHEALSEPPERLKPIVARRKEQRSRHAQVVLPETWTGNPEVIRVAAEMVRSDVVTGLPVSPGIVEGTVRVIDDSAEDIDLIPGEVLVCQTTDPSWTALFMVAGAVVIDIGGIMSHGAIVARDLGIPCVINTQTATKQLSTGDHVRVDGNTGEVVRFAPSYVVKRDGETRRPPAGQANQQQTRSIRPETHSPLNDWGHYVAAGRVLVLRSMPALRARTAGNRCGGGRLGRRHLR